MSTAKREKPEYVFCELPRCPRCDSTDHQTQHTDTDPDGSKCQRRKCRACGERFRVVWE